MDDRRRLTYLGGKLLKLSVKGTKRVGQHLAGLEIRGLRYIATYLSNADNELFMERRDTQPASQTSLRVSHV